MGNSKAQRTPRQALDDAPGTASRSEPLRAEGIWGGEQVGLEGDASDAIKRNRLVTSTGLSEPSTNLFRS